MENNAAHTCYIDTPLGPLIAESDGTNLTSLWYAECYGDMHGVRNVAECTLPIFQDTAKWLDIYFGGGIPDFTPPLAPKATPFQKLVFEETLKIPYGSTVSYGYIAKKVNEKKGYIRLSAQAVGGALKHNQLGIIIPCHRIIGADGRLIGYAGGMHYKIGLLRHEGIEVDTIAMKVL